MTDTSFSINVTNHTNYPIQVGSNQLTNGTWTTNPNGQVVNVEKTTDFPGTGTQPIKGTLAFIGFSNISVHFEIADDTLSYSTELPENLTDQGSTVEGDTLNLNIQQIA